MRVSSSAWSAFSEPSVLSVRAAGVACPPLLASRCSTAEVSSAIVSDGRESPEEVLAWQRFFRGERAALAELAERFRKELLDRIQRRVHERSTGCPPVDPEDVLQRMLLELWRRRLPIHVDNVGAYVFGTINKAVVNERRCQRGARISPHHVGAATPPARCLAGFVQSANEFMEPIDVADQWTKLVQGLSMSERGLVQMVQAGLGWRAIGDRLSIRPQAARMRFNRVATRLRRCLGSATRGETVDSSANGSCPQGRRAAGHSQSRIKANRYRRVIG
ncbi:MAG: RNA polymerase sigma factor [Planctomycetota bacterium]